MKISKYLSTVLLAGTLTACGDSFLEPQYSGAATSEEIANAAQDDPQGVLGSQLDGVYANLSFMSGTGASNINGHMDRGLCGIMMLSNNTSNDVSLYMVARVLARIKSIVRQPVPFANYRGNRH